MAGSYECISRVPKSAESFFIAELLLAREERFCSVETVGQSVSQSVNRSGLKEITSNTPLCGRFRK